MANLLGVSKRTVQRLEGVALTPIVVDGVTYFEPDKVRAYRDARKRKHPDTASVGELAAQVFERFNAAMTLPEIVCELRIDPRLVKALYLEWRTDLDTYAIDHDSRVRQ